MEVSGGSYLVYCGPAVGIFEAVARSQKLLCQTALLRQPAGIGPASSFLERISPNSPSKLLLILRCSFYNAFVSRVYWLAEKIVAFHACQCLSWNPAGCRLSWALRQRFSHKPMWFSCLALLLTQNWTRKRELRKL